MAPASTEFQRLLAACRDRGFKGQITRAGNSIAEGAERSGKAEFKQFLSYAKGSAGATRSQVLRAKALRYIPEEACLGLTAELREISRMIHGLITAPDRWPKVGCLNLNFPLQLTMPGGHCLDR